MSVEKLNIIYELSSLVIVLVYFIAAWFLLGNNKKVEPVILRTTPPESYSPAAIRYILNMNYDHRCTAIAIINIAIHGFLSIKEISTMETDKPYIDKELSLTELVIPADKEDIFQPEDNTLISDLVKQSNNIIEISIFNPFKNAINKFENALRHNFENRLFQYNTSIFMNGLIISAILIIVNVLLAYTKTGDVNGNESGMDSIIKWLLIAHIIVPFLFFYFFYIDKKQYFLSLSRYKFTTILLPAIIVTLLPSFIILKSMFKLGFCPINQLILVVLLAIINIIFYISLKSLSQAGRKIVNEIEGFRMYLKSERDINNSPEMTSELFELYLPYAIALNVESEWSNKFINEYFLNNKSYKPSWYSNTNRDFKITNNFAHDLCQSLTIAIISKTSLFGNIELFSFPESTEEE